METRTTVEEFLKYWGVQDVESSMTLVADDVIYRLNISKDAVPFGGETRGRDSLRANYYAILRDWDYVVFDPTVRGIDNDLARVQIRFQYRHRRSGLDLAGNYRVNFRVRDGLIILIEDIFDKELVETFMKMSKAQSNTTDASLDQPIVPPLASTEVAPTKP